MSRAITLAAAAAKSPQLCLTLCDHRQQLTRLPRPWNSSVKNTGVGFHILLQCMKLKSESEVTQLCLTLATPWTAAHQAPPSMGFSRQEYWSGVPLPSPCRILHICNYSLFLKKTHKFYKLYLSLKDGISGHTVITLLCLFVT